jgi:hypothetical protein
VCSAHVAKGEIVPGGPSLLCFKLVEIERPGECSATTVSGAPVPSALRGEIRYTATPVLDICTAKGLEVRVQAKRQPDDPFTGFVQVSLPGADVFSATVKKHEFPGGGAVFNPFHFPKLGVRCPVGWNAVPMGTNTLRCEKLDGPSIQADCDALWTRDNDKRGLEDRCIGMNEGPTKPRGMTKLQFDLDRSRDDVSWHLQEKAGIDRWQRKVYTFPISSDR